MAIKKARNATRKIFGKKRARLYDAWFKTKFGSFSDSLQKKAVFSMVSVRKGERALDIGCGTGRYSIELASKGAIVTGVDSAAEMLNIAAQKAMDAKTKVEFKKADASKLPFKPTSFELVIGINILELTPNPEKIIRETMRILKPGGRFVFGVLNKESLTALQRRLKGAFKQTIYNNARFFSVRELVKMVSTYGATGIKWKTVGHLPESKRESIVSKAEAVEKFGQKLLPRFGNFIVISGIKRQPKI